MKVWIKLLIGSLLGLTLGFLIPENQRLTEALVWLEQFVIRIGRFALIPVLVFSLTIAIFQLRQDGRLWFFVLKNLLLIAGASAFVITIGVLASFAFPLSRIPIAFDGQAEAIGLDIAENISALFPYNMFNILSGDGVYLLPFSVFAFFLAIGLSYDRNYSKPIVVLVDALSRVFYHIAAFFVEIIGFIIIVLSAYWAIRFRSALQMEVFLNLIILLGALALLLAFGIFPLFLYLLRPKVNPWKVLRGSLGPAIAAFFSGDINFTLPVMMRHFNESLGIRRRAGAVSLTLFGTFCRAGSAMVAAVAFIIIVRSNSPLGITPAEIVSICLHAFGVSFLLARHPGNGAFIALAALCIGYGRGFESNYLILQPIAFYLIAVGTFLDITVASFASFVSARISGFVDEKKV